MILYWLFYEMNGGMGIDLLMGCIIIDIIFIIIPSFVIAIKETTP